MMTMKTSASTSGEATIAGFAATKWLPAAGAEFVVAHDALEMHAAASCQRVFKIASGAIC